MKQATTVRAAFTYTPGDGHRYEWSGEPGQPVTVARITHSDGRITFRRTGDTIPAPAARRTATALMAAVDVWRDR